MRAIAVLDLRYHYLRICRDIPSEKEGILPVGQVEEVETRGALERPSGCQRGEPVIVVESIELEHVCLYSFP